MYLFNSRKQNSIQKMQYCTLYQAAIRTRSKGTSTILKNMKTEQKTFRLMKLYSQMRNMRRLTQIQWTLHQCLRFRWVLKILKIPIQYPCTLGQMLQLELFFSFWHYNLVGDAIEQLLSIIALALPEHHVLCTSLHQFKKYFRNLKNPLIHQHYCRNCFGLVEDKSLDKCPYEFCGQPFKLKTSSYFLEIPLETKLKIYSSKRDFTPAYNIDSRK